MIRWTGTLFLVISVLTVISISIAVAQTRKDCDISQGFIEANHLFNQGKFKEAASLYELAIKKVKNGELYYNLGNAYLKLGKLGKAILNYRNAYLYTPRSEDLKANINYARQLTRDKIEKKERYSVLNTVCFWYRAFSLRELFFGFLIVNGLFWTLALFRIWFRNEFLYWSLLSSFILFIITGSTLGTKIYNTFFVKEGVVTTKELGVRAGNGPNNTVLFYLHDGTECKILNGDGGWLKIELADGKKGWVQKKFVGIVGG